MNIYDIVMTPVERFLLRDIRSELLSKAKGDILEIGFGTGTNFKYYNYDQIKSLTCMDIDHQTDIKNRYPKASFIIGNVENIPFDDNSFDCVVSTLVLCSVDASKSLKEILRVLKHGGIYIFIEHVKPTGNMTSKIADSVNNIWSKMANGCNLNRQTDQILENSGFNKIAMKSCGVFRYGIAEKI